jgi:hypothetical protein
MGIEITVAAFSETPEEREIKKRAAFKKRLLILSSTLIISVVARFIIKDPPPPKVVDRTNDQVRYFPGMLDGLPPSERAKLKPQMIAKMMEADNAKSSLTRPSEVAVAQGSYKPASPLPGTEPPAYQIATRPQNRTKINVVETPPDLSKPMLVHFNNGNYLRVEKANLNAGNVQIRFDRTLVANFPSTLVSSVDPNGLNWEEPVPKGYVRLKPAKGISITVRKELGEQITVPGDGYGEI